MKDKNNICQMCGANVELTKHHLIPRVKAKNKYKEIRDDESNLIWICRQCHDAIHANFSENELRDVYNTLESLMRTPEISKFVAWRKKHLDFTGSAKMSNKRKY